MVEDEALTDAPPLIVGRDAELLKELPSGNSLSDLPGHVPGPHGEVVRDDRHVGSGGDDPLDFGQGQALGTIQPHYVRELTVRLSSSFLLPARGRALLPLLSQPPHNLPRLLLRSPGSDEQPLRAVLESRRVRCRRHRDDK